MSTTIDLRNTPISFDLMLDRIRLYTPGCDLSPVTRAYQFSSKAHTGQCRASGEPYVQHPLEVANILTYLKMDIPSIAAGLLHDIVEDTPYSCEVLKKEFGEEVAQLVHGVTKIGQIAFKNVHEKQAENLRKMVVSMAQDIRVVLIKLADRLHNMRTLSALQEEQKKRIAQETLDIYAPLANRLGIDWMKAELEDLCLFHLKPDICQTLKEKTLSHQARLENDLQSATAIIQKTMADNHVMGKVTGRQKHLFGIYKKMQKQGIPFEEVYDVMGVRIITDTKANCYAVLGLVHSLFRPVPGRFKDYIASPKSNLYQTLHTTVIGPDGKYVEFQIRTEEMHRTAENGIASHWIYKEGHPFDPKDQKTFAWLRQMVEWQQELTDTRQFINSVKTDLLHDLVYVCSPKGDVKELIQGATPVDFAYAIHTDVGHHCTGAKVNGKIVPLRYILRTGDQVEILTLSSHNPSKDWLKFVKSPRAKVKIKHAIQEKERAQSLIIGKKLLETALRKEKISPTEVLKSEALLAGVKGQGIHSMEALYIAVGYGNLSATQVIRPLVHKPTTQEASPETTIKRQDAMSPLAPIKGWRDILTRLSKCCNPVPGDAIIGFVTRGRGLAIHTTDCPNSDFMDYDPARLVSVSWEEIGVGKHSQETHTVHIRVLVVDKPGMLAAVSASISEAGANISRAEASTTEDKRGEFFFDMHVTHTAQLEKVLNHIETLEGVIHVYREKKGHRTNP